MALKFEKCKRRFDVTVKIQAYEKHDWQTVYEGTISVWSYGPSARQLNDPILDETGVTNSGTRISILYLREHEFSDYSPAQMGKMMAQEGYGFSDNPYVDINHVHADVWADMYVKEQKFNRSRS